MRNATLALALLLALAGCKDDTGRNIEPGLHHNPGEPCAVAGERAVTKSGADLVCRRVTRTSQLEWGLL